MSQRSNLKGSQWIGPPTLCLVMLFVFGCGGTPASNEQDALQATTPSSNEASELISDIDIEAIDVNARIKVDPPVENTVVGPHGGTLTSCAPLTLDMEVVIDRNNQTISVYVWHSVKKILTPLAAKQLLIDINVPDMRIELTPVKNIGEPTDMSSHFRGSHAKLATDQKLTGTIYATIEREKHQFKFYELPNASMDF